MAVKLLVDDAVLRLDVPMNKTVLVYVKNPLNDVQNQRLYLFFAEQWLSLLYRIIFNFLGALLDQFCKLLGILN